MYMGTHYNQSCFTPVRLVNTIKTNNDEGKIKTNTRNAVRKGKSF